MLEVPLGELFWGQPGLLLIPINVGTGEGHRFSFPCTGQAMGALPILSPFHRGLMRDSKLQGKSWKGTNYGGILATLFTSRKLEC